MLQAFIFTQTNYKKENSFFQHDENWKPADDLGMNLLATFYSKRINETEPFEERRWHKQVACANKENLHNFREPVEGMPWHLQFSVCKGDVQQVGKTAF